MSYLFITIAALLPVLAMTGFFFLKKYTKFDQLNYSLRQVIYGVVFGGLAIVGTHWGIRFSGYTANARDAAVLICGLMLGCPAGLIAGTIGGVERLIVGLVLPEQFGFTAIACSLSTFLAGGVAALIRRFVFEHRRPKVISGLFIGLVMEVFHLFMVFVTNSNQYEKAYNCVIGCALPMIIANSLAVVAAVIVYNALEKGKEAFKKPDPKTLNNRFVFILSGVTIVTFVLSSLFVYLFNDNINKLRTNNSLEYSITEVANEISQKTIEKAYTVAEVLNRNKSEWYVGDETHGLGAFCIKEDIAEINIIDAEGTIRYSNEAAYVNSFNMTAKEGQSKEFHYGIMNSKDGYFVQEFRPPTDLEKEERKYAGVRFTFEYGDPKVKTNGYIQVGYNQAGVDKLAENIALHKSVGNNGALIVLNKNYQLVSVGKDVELPEDLTPLTKLLVQDSSKYNKTFSFESNNEKYYAQYRYEDTHYIVSLLPVSEAMLNRNLSLLVNTFLEIIVFGLLFLTIYILVKRLVIDKIEATNKSLGEITNGNLDVVVDAGDTTEFKVLANDINETVSALKGYIDAANKRIDEELAMAKAIQTAVLPSTFPAFPDRKEFDIFASMHPAKEVGGDFYDFYFSNQENFHFTVADVSGKGIPAALFMMRAKSVLKSLTQTNIPINEVFSKANDGLCGGNEAGMFVTAWSASVDLTNGSLTFANGGHNPPLIKHKNGKFEYLRAPVNLVLAAMEGMPYGINKLQLEIGDMVYLYTDGVTEGINDKGEQFGEARLQEALNSKEFSSCRELCEYVYDECVKFANGAAQFDDITMVAFRFDGFKK